MSKSFLDKDGLRHLIGKVAKKVHTHTKSQITDFPESMPASDVPAWAKAASKPTYTATEVGAAPASHGHSYNDLSDKPTIPTIPSSLPANGGDANTAVSTKPVTTAGTGAAYTATVAGITALTAGVQFIMVPHTASTSKTPTLNVNSLGAKGIRRRLSNLSTSVQAGYATSWLGSGKAYTLTYDGTYWIVEGMSKPASADLYGTLGVDKGGTGATDAATARTNLGIKTEEWTLTYEDGTTETKVVYVG